ncbi:MAG: carbamoyltransferase HypF [Halothiobacillaceae bacterium]
MNRSVMPRPERAARLIRVRGRVQGVGFRPHVYRLATSLDLPGWVRNDSRGVTIHVEGDAATLLQFENRLLTEAPSRAMAVLESSRPTQPADHECFVIRNSEPAAGAQMPVDLPPCPDCLAELFDPNDRRYRHPFISCTQCGPRYSLITALPYDRPNTAMASFALCPDCVREYQDPGDRRFHAQPLCCPNCGPQLRWLSAPLSPAGDSDPAFPADRVSADPVRQTRGPVWQSALDRLRAGGIIAVRAVGGYQLAADATDETAVARLRQIKHRPDKPLAVLFATAEAVGEAGLALEPASVEALLSSARPVVPLSRTSRCTLPDRLAPGLDSIGVMLPNSPLQVLLLTDFGGPLVMTSANRSGEPMITDREHLARVLPGIDGVLDHDRPIVNAVDDPVVRVIDATPRPLRPGRGNAPLELRLADPVPEPVLALGGQQKVTLALAWTDRVVISPQLGDLENPAALAQFVTQMEAMQARCGVRAARLLCDRHPDYVSTRWAQSSGQPLARIAHHRAHASALWGDAGINEPMLVFTWDGLGLGDPDDSSSSAARLWGGEVLLGRPGNWVRVATLAPFPLPGGTLAARAPWRCAFGLALASGHPWRPATQSIETRTLLEQACRAGLNCPITHSVGRLFDAVAFFCGFSRECSHEGQAAMWLESQATNDPTTIELPWIDKGPTRQLDWSPLLDWLIDPDRDAGEKSSLFHHSLARAVGELAGELAGSHAVHHVGLTGGVFQNRRLTEACCRQLESRGLEPELHRQVPCNDAGLSLGQIIEWHAGG